MDRLMSGAVPIVLGMVFSFLGTAFIARMVGPAVFGEYIFFLTWISVAALLSKAGHEWVLLKIIPGRLQIGALGQIRYILRKSFIAVMLRAAAAAGILGGMAALSGYWLDPGTLAAGLALVWVMAIAELRRSWALAHRAVWLSDAPENIAKSLLLAGSVAVLMAWGVKVEAGTIIALNLGITLATALAATLAFFHFFAPMLLAAKPEPLPEDLAETRGLVWATWFAAFANILLRNLDLMILGLLVDAATVGHYAVASRLALLAAGPIMVLDRLVTPVLSAAASTGDRLSLEVTSKRFVLMAGVGAIVVLIVFAVAGDILISIIFGVKYVESLTIALIIMIGNLFAALAGPAGVVMIVGGAHRESTTVTVVAMLVNLVLLAVLTPVFGAIGAAIATAAGISTKAVISAIVVDRRLHVKTSVVLFWRASK